MPLPLAFRPAPASLPPGERVYAIGDVHGLDVRLGALHAAILADLAARPVARPQLVHLGDYIDRGPDSAGVVARLRGGPPAPGLAMTCLMGNHERNMIDALGGDRGAGRDWLAYGGDAALASWGADPATGPAGWRQAVPATDLDWLATLPLTHGAGGYLFVHAGVRPGVALALQAPDDLLWIRGDFLHSVADHGAVVVHGHTPAKAVELRANRIGIDTGAVFGGPLTCLMLEADRLGLIEA